MNQIVYYKSKYLALLILLCLPIEARLLKPSMNGEQKEILIINSKRRLYYPVNDEGIQYLIQGPVRLEFISRYPVLKKKKVRHTYRYNIVLNKKDTVKVNHRYKTQKSIRSVQHPKHSYTFSGNYYINLGKGSHQVQIIKGENLKYPVLLRVLAKEFESLGDNKKTIVPMVYQRAVKLVSKQKEIEYFECTSELPLQIEVKGVKTLRIMNRLEFSDIMGNEDVYRLRISEGMKIIGTYYFNSERSSESTITGKEDIVPGKWRSCDISVPIGSHIYTVEVADKGKTVFTRFILY